MLLFLLCTTNEMEKVDNIIEQYFNKGDYQTCIEKLNSILKELQTPNPRNKALLFIGKSYYFQGKLDKAVEILWEVKGPYRDEALYWIDKAVKGELPEIPKPSPPKKATGPEPGDPKKVLERAKKIRLQYYNIFQPAAKIFSKYGNYNDAVTALEEAKKLAPDDPEVLYMLCGVYYKLGKYQKANEILQEWKKVAPEDQRIPKAEKAIKEKLKSASEKGSE